jgi:hypothetical protein
MRESQTTEFKETWRDEYLKWICGFANAEGGLLIIGRSDRGEAVGVANAAKLMEDLPNKIRDVLGVIADVRLLEIDGTGTAYQYPSQRKRIWTSVLSNNSDGRQARAAAWTPPSWRTARSGFWKTWV